MSGRNIDKNISQSFLPKDIPPNWALELVNEMKKMTIEMNKMKETQEKI